MATLFWKPSESLPYASIQTAYPDGPVAEQPAAVLVTASQDTERTQTEGQKDPVARASGTVKGNALGVVEQPRQSTGLRCHL